jgi:F-type H+-transporting ATPase subunit gamma
MLASHINVGEGMKPNRAAEIADELVEPYLEGKYERVELFYTEYVSPILQQAVTKPLLPVELHKELSGSKALPIYEPSASEVFNSIVPKYISGIIFGSVVDSFASEQACRRSAMENASDNAQEMISDLSLKYNRARQASITQELTEIVSGAAAQE